MKNELIVIEATNALSVLTDQDQVEKLIAEVQEKVNNLDGGNMETGVGRKAIISNANKAKKSKTALNKMIDTLICQQNELITEKTKPEVQAIALLKQNKARLGEGLDNIYKETRQSVTDFENELKRVKAEAEAKAIKIEIDNAHELALLLDEKFNVERDAKLKSEAEAEKQRLADEAAAQAVRDEEIRQQAAREAQEKAEREKEQLIIDAMHSEALLINRDIDDKIAEQKRIADKIEADKRAQQQAEETEVKRLADIAKAKKDAEEEAESNRLAEIKRQQDEAKRVADEKAKREANEKHASMIMKQTKESIMELGLSEEDAKLVTLALKNGKIANVGTINF